MKSSQSISDLSSHIQEKHHRSNRLSTGNKSGQQNQFSKPINPCKPILNPKPTFKSQQSINKVQGNALPKLEISNENCLSKNPTMLCINEKAKSLSRPLTLTLKKTEKYKLSLNKANQSLPESPVCEELKLLKEQCKKDISRFARFAQKRRSCSYFIGLNDNEKDMESVAKSFESLPAMNERNIENLKETIDDADEGNGNFSDDSLEGDFKNPPRRCVSDYQINVHMNDCRSYSNYQNIQKKILTGSQESILSDASVESFSKGSAEILDYNHYDHDRHSSASFFLSRRKMQEARSQESILTDESDYQMFPLRENADHRSTESVLTDDSDSLVKSAPLEMLFDSHYKRKRQNSETYNGNPNNIVETATDNTQSSVNENTLYRAVFRSKSLQDTRINNTRNNMNFTEDNASMKTHVYCEFNFDNEHKDDVADATICSGPNNVPRSSSMKVPTKPESMMILNDFVAHKPPKPKRNSSRTQSMRNRARPTWKYIDTPPSSPALKNIADSDNYTASSMSSACSEYRVTQGDTEIKQDSIDSEGMQQFLQSANYVLQSDDNKDSGCEFYSLQTHRTDKNGTLQDELMYDRNDSSRLTKNHHVTKIHDTKKGQCISYNKEQVNLFENDIPTKDTYETYDSLEPGEVCDLQKGELSLGDNSNLQSTNECISDLKASVDFRITRAIEGTVKLLSKEFENLVRQKQYLTKEKCWRLTQGQETSENFAKLEAERDGRFCAIRRDIRLHSCGEDSDCADVSAMDRSLMESGSSTSASSCTNSPKRMWPPASRCPSHTKWTKTLPTIDQTILSTKHPYAGIERVENACVAIFSTCC